MAETIGWTGADDPCIQKFLKALYWWGADVTSIKVYGRVEPTSAGTLLYTVASPADSDPQFFDCDKMFREIKIVFEGATAIVKRVIIQIEERRL